MECEMILYNARFAVSETKPIYQGTPSLSLMITITWEGRGWGLGKNRIQSIL